jgi:hypothetical protein
MGGEGERGREGGMKGRQREGYSALVFGECMYIVYMYSGMLLVLLVSTSLRLFVRSVSSTCECTGGNSPNNRSHRQRLWSRQNTIQTLSNQPLMGGLSVQRN